MAKGINTSYFVYILKCSDGTLYAGTTNDISKRVETHNSGKTAAKYTRTRRPVKLVYSEKVKDKGAALKREWEIKKMKREEKLGLIKEKTSRRMLHFASSEK